MSNRKILLFLHGIGGGDKEGHWKLVLNEALTRLEYSDLNQVEVISPQYAHALKGWDEKEVLPDLTVKQPIRDVAKQNRRDFEHRMGAVEFRLGRHNRGTGWVGGDAVVHGAVLGGAAGIGPIAQAHNYLNDPQVRAQVLNRTLATLPESGDLVIVGYSLGSVIAADLLRRLPIDLKVDGMVTIGSPLANGSFNVDKLRDTLNEPPTNLAWWVNFWNAGDPIAAHRGVSSVFPWIVDFRIDTKKVLLDAHAAEEYLADESVASAIGFALFGSKSKELAGTDMGFDVPMNATEFIALLALRYASLIKMRLESDLQDRYAGAIRRVQAAVVDDLSRQNETDRRTLPSSVARLAFDLSNPHATVPEPLPSPHIAKDEAVALLITLASVNVIRPFEIEVSKDNLRDAMKDLTAEMGLGSKYGADVFAAIKLAHETLSSGGPVNWFRWGAMGVGAAAIVLATGGMALAAAPGLVGAAVITSALASFGPGGMIGGLLTAGALVTAGGGGIAFGLASPGTTAETLEVVVERRLAAAILRQSQQLEPDHLIWRFLVETEIQVRREYERLDEFSDESATTLKELRRKIDAIERALKYLRANGLEPQVPHFADE